MGVILNVTSWDPIPPSFRVGGTPSPAAMLRRGRPQESYRHHQHPSTSNLRDDLRGRSGRTLAGLVVVVGWVGFYRMSLGFVGLVLEFLLGDLMQCLNESLSEPTLDFQVSW